LVNACKVIYAQGNCFLQRIKELYWNTLASIKRRAFVFSLERKNVEIRKQKEDNYFACINKIVNKEFTFLPGHTTNPFIPTKKCPAVH
jgi:hypothetical protein